MNATASLPSIEVVERFTGALRLAVHDAVHESGNEINLVHYWDTDCLYVPARGFLGLEKNKQSADDLVVQALYSAGQVGRVALTTPHRAEFLRQVDIWAEESGNRPYGAAATEFVRNQDLSAIRDLSAALSHSSSGGGLEPVVQKLRELDRVSFAYVESLNGPWHERLGRLLSDGTLDVSASGPSIDRIAGDERFDLFAEAIGHYRHDRGRPLSTSFDASALTAIAIMNDEAARSGSETYVRFYTASKSLKRLYSSEGWVKELFQFPFDHADSERSGTVWRDAYYYLLRAIFPSLSASTKIEPLRGSPSLDELAYLSEELHRTLVDTDTDIMRFVQRFRFENGQSLAQAILDLESTGMANIWVQYDPSEYASRLIDGIDSITTLGEMPATEEILSGLFRETGDSLRTELEESHKGYTILDPLWRALNRVVPVLGADSVSVTVDLGSIRWGLRYWGDEDRFPTPATNPAEAFGAITPLLSIDSVVSSLMSVERYSSILVGLRLFGAAQRLIEEAATVGTTSASLHLLDLVCRVRRLGKSLDGDDGTAVAVFEEVSSAWRSTPQSRRPELAVGFGYLVFSVWEATQSAIFEAPADPRGIALYSFELVLEHVDDLRGIQRDFAINHLVYTGSLANIKHPRLTPLTLELEQRAAKLDNYRFLDTVGFRGYLFAARAALRDGFSETWHRDYCPSLREATETLRTASELAKGDREITQHFNAAFRLAEDSGCGDRKAGD